MKKTKFLIALAVLHASCIIYAQAPDWQWINTSIANFHATATGITTDADGNVYTGGIFSGGSISFGETTFNSANERLFITKYNSLGELQWAKSTNTNAASALKSITSDSDGNIYITGIFSQELQLGDITLEGSEQFSMFIAKMDAGGNLLWAKKAGNTGMTVALKVVAGANNSVYVAGHFNTPELAFGDTTLLLNGSSDVFLAKYDSDGNEVWAASIGGTDDALFCSMAVDGTGNPHIAACFMNQVNVGTAGYTTSGGFDIVLAKYTTQGNPVWSKKYGSTLNDYVSAMDFDSNNDLFISGTFESTNITFGTTTLQNTGQYDIYILKLNNDATENWAVKAGGASIEGAYTISAGADNKIYLGGYFDSNTFTIGNTTLGKGPAISVAFIAALDSSDASVQWTKQTSGTHISSINDIALHENKIYTAGHYLMAVNIGNATFTTPNSNMFITRLGTGSLDVTSHGEGGTISVWPNPAGEQLHILSGVVAHVAEYIVYDISGRAVKKGTMSQNTIDVAQLTEGHYAITFDNGTSVRFMKK